MAADPLFTDAVAACYDSPAPADKGTRSRSASDQQRTHYTSYRAAADENAGLRAKMNSQPELVTSHQAQFNSASKHNYRRAPSGGKPALYNAGFDQPHASFPARHPAGFCGRIDGRTSTIGGTSDCCASSSSSTPHTTCACS